MWWDSLIKLVTEEITITAMINCQGSHVASRCCWEWRSNRLVRGAGPGGNSTERERLLAQRNGQDLVGWNIYLLLLPQNTRVILKGERKIWKFWTERMKWISFGDGLSIPQPRNHTEEQPSKGSVTAHSWAAHPCTNWCIRAPREPSGCW